MTAEHQEEFLYNFFNQVSQLCFDKAKESVEKEKESCKSTQMGPWGMLLTYLPQIIMVERSYSDLSFLQAKNKSFLRKDNSLKSIYESLRSDFKKLEEVTGGSPALESKVSELSNQLSTFITARIALIDFYEKMYIMSTNNKVMRYGELLQSIEHIANEQSSLYSRSVLTAIQAALILECDILVQLIKAQIHVQNWQFLPSLAALNDAQIKMNAWEKSLQNRESWKIGFGATFLKTNQLPALFQWLSKLRSAILAKFSLYFHTTLCQQTNSSDMRNIMSKQSVDYYHKMQTFQRKYDTVAIALVFDLRTSQDSGPSYRHPKRELDSSDKFAFIASCPGVFMQKVSVHWSAIKRCIEEHHSELLLMEKVLLIKGPMDLITYAFLNVDSNTTLVTVYESSKQKDKESHVTTFMTDLCTQIRCNKVYESLKMPK